MSSMDDMPCEILLYVGRRVLVVCLFALLLFFPFSLFPFRVYIVCASFASFGELIYAFVVHTTPTGQDSLSFGPRVIGPFQPRLLSLAPTCLGLDHFRSSLSGQLSDAGCWFYYFYFLISFLFSFTCFSRRGPLTRRLPSGSAHDSGPRRRGWTFSVKWSSTRFILTVVRGICVIFICSSFFFLFFSFFFFFFIRLRRRLRARTH